MSLNMSSDNSKLRELLSSTAQYHRKASNQGSFDEFSSLTLLVIPHSSLSTHPPKDLLHETRHISKMMYEK